MSQTQLSIFSLEELGVEIDTSSDFSDEDESPPSGLTYGPFRQRMYRFDWPAWLTFLLESVPEFMTPKEVQNEWSTFQSKNPGLSNLSTDSRALLLKNFLNRDVPADLQMEISGGMIQQMWLSYKDLTFSNALTILNFD